MLYYLSRPQKEWTKLMSYTYSWERTSTLSPLDFMQEQNDIWEDENPEESEFNLPDTPDFDPDEIL
jgi:hypothetical protein